jgi:uncharacterized protein (DUF362 family)
MDPVVAVVQAPGVEGSVILERALSLSRFGTIAVSRIETALAERGICTAMVVPSLDAFRRDSPAATDPALVEQLLDLLFDLGAQPAVGSTRATASLWLENREVFMAADLLGYGYQTPAGRPYEVVDLAEDLVPGVFAAGGPLDGVGLSRAWLEADLRIVFSANRTDEDDGYALCLSTLVSVLPASDKDYQYRYRRDIGEVAAALLDAAPVHFALIDAVVSGHGGGGARAPRALRTDTVIAASNPVLADYAGALKMGLDPFVSRLAAPSLRRNRPTPQTRVIGPLEPYEDWVNVAPALMASTRARGAFVEADRSVRPWLQDVDPDLFPFRDPANQWLNQALAGTAAAGDMGADGSALLAFANLWLAEAGKAGEAWNVMFDKDALRQREAPINIDVSLLTEADFQTLPALLGPQAELLRGLAADPEGVRWRFDDGAVMFDGVRRFPIPFEAFTGAVEIHRTIQFMNDYVGGRALAVGRDADGRVTRQVERNLYLPQPNYTAVGGGVVIDVTKIETVVYAARWQRMYWRTVRSQNDSALVDDGIVSFEALGDDTLATIWGRQHFRLPPMWAAIDQGLAPQAKRALVAEAYGQFFRRTFANLEGVAEGRDMRIGRPWSDAPQGEPLPVERLSGLFQGLQAQGGLPDLLRRIVKPEGEGRPKPVRIDADGFHHFQGAAATAAAGERTPSVLAEVARDLGRAARIDADGLA